MCILIYIIQEHASVLSIIIILIHFLLTCECSERTETNMVCFETPYSFCGV